jgi:hypothetical protein
MALPTTQARLVRWSLAAVWLITAWVSVQGLAGISLDLLAALPLAPGAKRGLILSAALWDAALGLALLWPPKRWVLWASGATVLGFSALAGLLHPALWLHPFGPLLKNLPILTLLWLLTPETKP